MARKKKTWEEHVEDFRKIHGGRYEYPESQVLEKGNKTKITITCKEHGIFEQVANNHRKGQGCPYCSGREVHNEGMEVLCDDGIIREIIGPKRAKKLCLDRYFTGKPCDRGHLSERFVGNSGCLVCREEYYQDNKGKIQEYQKEYSKEYRQENKEYLKEYRQENKERRNEYWKERYANDPNYKTSVICRNMLKRTLEATSSTKDSRTYEFLGYCNEELKQNIESKFLPGMSWDNYGEWHIDHKYPVSRYIQDGITDPAIINSLDNLIPMWDHHNMSKSAMTLEEFLEREEELSEIYGEFLETE